MVSTGKADPAPGAANHHLAALAGKIAAVAVSKGTAMTEARQIVARLRKLSR